MRYSLLSRFRGALLGAVISEQQLLGSVSSSGAIIRACEHLVKLGNLDVTKWVELQPTADAKQRKTELLLMTLPVALFFHENPSKLRQTLLDTVKMWGDDPILRDTVLVFGYAIALSLQERLTSSNLIPQLAVFLGETSTDIPQQLFKVQELWLERASLEDVKSEFRRENQLSDPIAIPAMVNYALYCFISSLEDFQLSVLRSSTAGIITGALSGAYNSVTGIPIFWQSDITTGNNFPDIFPEIIKLSDQLFAVWSGIYDFTNSANYDTFGRFAVVSARMVKWE